MPTVKNTLRILGIETSCDETAVAIVQYEKDSVTLLANIVSSQISLHAPFGGVVPNLAAREHEKNLPSLLKETFEVSHLSPESVDAIAVTHGPGLIPALLVGTTAARTLSYLWKKPLLGIHHIEGHIYANFLNKSENVNKKTPASKKHPIFPLLALVVSGGHTQLVLMREHFTYEILGETQDDAVGEAFDKVARILGLGYPGGPAVSAAAIETEHGKRVPENETWGMKPASSSPLPPTRFPLPRPMLHSKDFHFSFSGLKTAVLYTVKKFRTQNNLPETASLPNTFINDLCAEFQQAAIDVLVKKTIRAAEKYAVKTVILAGGVSANTELRNQLHTAVSKLDSSISCHLSPIALSTDNAAMIAVAGAFRFARMSETEKEKTLVAWKTLSTRATISLNEE